MTGRAKFGLTWWGQRWIGALEALGAVYANRLPRGRTYARRGAVSDLVVQPGSVTARVQGSRARPYRVRLGLPVFDDATWDAVLAALAGQVRHSAQLLDGRMPDDVDDVLAACGVSLFPRAGELDPTCSCPDWANPCKHVAAVHYVLAQAFDADPFLLPRLRGRDRDVLLAGLRAARAGGKEPLPDEPRAEGPVPVAALQAAGLWDAAGDLAAIAVCPAPPRDPGAALRRVGPPPADAGERVLAQLEEHVRAAAALAWRLVGEAGDDADPLLDALRARGAATSRELAADVDRPLPEVRAGLRRLVADGLVRRTGHARSTRYEA